MVGSKEAMEATEAAGLKAVTASKEVGEQSAVDGVATAEVEAGMAAVRLVARAVLAVAAEGGQETVTLEAEAVVSVDSVVG